MRFGGGVVPPGKGMRSVRAGTAAEREMELRQFPRNDHPPAVRTSVEVEQVSTTERGL